MSLLFNMLFRLVITFLPRSKHLLISQLQSPSAVILEPRKIKSATVSPSIYHEVMGPDATILVFWMLSFKPIFHSPLSLSPHIALEILIVREIKLKLVFLLQTLVTEGEKWEERDRLGVWHYYVQNKQQGPTVQHRKLSSIFCSNLYRKIIWKRMDTCLWKTE